MVVIYPKKYGLTSAHEYRQNGQLVTYSYSLFSSVAAPRPHNSCHIASNPNEESNTLHQDGEKAHLTPTPVRSKRSIVSTHPYFDHSSASSTSTSGSISSTGSTGSIASLSSSTSNITKANMSRRFHEENENTQTNRGHFHINESLKSLSSRLNKHITPQMTHIREIVRNRQKHRPVERSEFIRQNIALNGTHKSRFDAIRSIIRGGGNNDGSGSSGNVVLGRRNKEGTEEGEIGEVNEEDMGNPHVDSSTYTDLAEDSSIRYNQQKDAEVTKNPMNSNKVRESKFGHHNVTQIADIKGVVSSSPSSPPLDTPSTIPRDIGDIYNKKYDRDVKNTFQGSTSEVPDGIGVTATDSMVIGDNAFITASNRKVIVNHEDLSQNSQQPQQSNLNKVLSTETPTSTSTSTSVPIPSTPTSTTSTISTAVIPDISLETEHTHVDEPVQTHRHISDCTRRYLRVYGEEHRRSLLSSDEYWREQIDTIPWFQKPKIVQYKLGQQNTSYTSDSTVPNPTLTQNAPLQQYIAEIEESENIQSDTVWYPDGTLNMSFAMLDHHILQGRGDQIAFYYESCYNSVLSKQSEVQQETEIKQETGVRKEATTRTTNMTKEEDNHTLGSMSVAMTYSELLKHVEAYAAGLRSYGIQKGDRVLIYMPMILETAIAMIACARVGAVHTVVFGGFASVELAKRMKSSGCKLVLTASCGLEPNKVIDYKSLVDKAFDVLQAEKEDIEKKYKKSGEEMTSEMRSDLKSQLVNLETILSNKVIIVQRKSFELPSSRFIPDRDVDVADFLLHGKKYKLSNPKASSPEVMSSYDPSYILYTSGTTGNPKGVIRDTGSTAVALYHSLRTVYGMYPGETWFAASDMGWQVGHSFIVYGPLLLGCSSVLFEGKPIQTPDASTYWRILAKYNVRGFFTAPTALRAIKREDPELKLLQKYKPYIQGVKTIDVGVDIDVDVDEDEDEREGEGKSKAKGKGKGKVNSIQFHGEGQRQGQGQGREEEYISATTTNTNTANTSTSSSTHTHISTSAISQSQHTSQSDDTSLPTKRLGLADLYGSTSVGVTTAIAVEDNHANPSHTTNTPSTKTSNSTEILKTEPVQGLFGYEFSSGLRALFIAGEKADSDTIDWLHDALDIPIIDHWWQTETGTPITGPVFPLNVLDEAKEISTNLGMISKYLEEHSDFEGDVEDEIEREIEKEKKREEERDKENISSNISSLSLPLSNHSHYTPVNHNHYIHWTIVPGSTGLPCFGYNVKILDDHGCEVPPLRIGNIVIQLPLPPGCLLGLWESGDRYKRGYTTRFPGYYDSADCGYIDEHGYLYVMSRTDDVMNVAGHRLSTGSIEEILAKHPKVAECCVVGLPDPLKGEVPIGFVVLKRGVETPNSRNDSVNIKNNIMKNITHDIPKDDKVHDNREEMHKKLQYELVQLVRSSVGSIATPKRIIVVDKLPKTKSGKLLRATIRNIIKFTKDKADEKFPIFSKIVPTPPTIEDETVLEYLRFVIEKEELF